MVNFFSRHPHISGMLFASIFGLTFMFTKVLLEEITPMGIIAYRFMLAILTMEVFRRFRIITVNVANKPVRLLVVIALLQPILYFLLETTGIQYVTSSEAGMMIALIPIMVAVLSPFFGKERPTLLQIAFIALSVSGVFFINWMKSSLGEDVSVLGISLIFMAVVAAALFNLFSRRARDHFQPADITYVMMATGAIVFNGIYLTQLLLEGNPWGYVTLLSTSSIFPLMYLGIMASVGGFFLVNTSLAKLPAHVSSVYANIATIVAVIAGSVVLSEAILWFHWIGAGMIVTGVYGTNRFRRRSTL
jgi:drug/metabolite transporter (DMT)-like permease